MTAYVVNENVNPADIARIAIAASSVVAVMAWPSSGAALPGDISIAILVVNSSNSSLEEARVVSSVGAGIRLVCVYLQQVHPISDLAQKYCSAKADLSGGGFLDAMKGLDSVQESSTGGPAPKNPQKPHNC